MQASAQQIADLLQGEVEGNPAALVSRPGQIESAQAGEMTFLDSAKYEQYAYTTKASILLVSKAFQAKAPINATLIRVDNVRESLMLLLQYFNGADDKKQGERSSHAFIDPNAVLDNSVSVGHFSVISEKVEIGAGTHISEQVFLGKNVKIGKNCLVYPGVKIYHGSIIGDNCILHSNAVIGADGFGFVPQPDRSWKKVPQVGNVVIQNDVEIGANTCIDRAALGSTIIKKGAKLDNLIHIAHNVEIGANTALAAQVGIAGSTHVGANCIMGGQAGLAGHIKVAEGTQVQAQSGIPSSIKEPNTAVFGSPAIPYKDFVRAFIVFKQLPALEKRLRTVEKSLDS